MAAVASDILKELRDLGVATVYEAGGGTGALDAAIKPVWPGAKVCGPAYTVKCHPGDNLALHHSLEFVSPGDVLVVHNGGLHERIGLQNCNIGPVRLDLELRFDADYLDIFTVRGYHSTAVGSTRPVEVWL